MSEILFSKPSLNIETIKENKFVNSAVALMDLAGNTLQKAGQRIYETSVLLDYKIRESIFFKSNTPVKKKEVKKAKANIPLGLVIVAIMGIGGYYLFSQLPKDGSPKGDWASKQCLLETIQPNDLLTNLKGVTIKYQIYHGDNSFKLTYSAGNPNGGKDISETIDPATLEIQNIPSISDVLIPAEYVKSIYKIKANPRDTLDVSPYEILEMRAERKLVPKDQQWDVYVNGVNCPGTNMKKVSTIK